VVVESPLLRAALDEPVLVELLAGEVDVDVGAGGLE
jgi:hypothetical protein